MPENPKDSPVFENFTNSAMTFTRCRTLSFSSSGGAITVSNGAENTVWPEGLMCNLQSADSTVLSDITITAGSGVTVYAVYMQ